MVRWSLPLTKPAVAGRSASAISRNRDFVDQKPANRDACQGLALHLSHPEATEAPIVYRPASARQISHGKGGARRRRAAQRPRVLGACQNEAAKGPRRQL